MTGRSRRRPQDPPAAAGLLRIIGGRWRGRKLRFTAAEGLRPTPDRVRETLFNWLTADLLGARVLDVFAGTGALGLEALSRGAREASFVERDPHVARQLEENLATLGATARGRVVNADAMAFLAGPPTPCSLVFLDPPFRQGLAGACCNALEAGWLDEEALVYVETESVLAPEVPANWQLHREVRAGDSTGRLYRRHPPATRSPDGDAC